MSTTNLLCKDKVATKQLHDMIKITEFLREDDLLRFIDSYAEKDDADIIIKFIDAARNLTMLESYDRMCGEATRERHCARCHETYTKETNKDGSCVIPHLFEPESEWLSGHDPHNAVYEHKAECCKGVVLHGRGEHGDQYGDEDLPGPCFKGNYTEDVKKAKGDYNRTSIVPCKHEDSNKCARTHWKYYALQPVFNMEGY